MIIKRGTGCEFPTISPQIVMNAKLLEKFDDEVDDVGDADDIYIMMKCLCVCHKK